MVAIREKVAGGRITNPQTSIPFFLGVGGGGCLLTLPVRTRRFPLHLLDLDIHNNISVLCVFVIERGNASKHGCRGFVVPPS